MDWIIISFEQVEDAAKYDNLQTTYVRPKRSSATDKVVNTFSQVTQLIQLLLPGLGGKQGFLWYSNIADLFLVVVDGFCRQIKRHWITADE